MMPPWGRRPMAVWAARDILRRPGQTLLLCASLGALALCIGAPLLYHQALATTLSQLLAAAPDLVVKRIGSNGWAPVPAEAAVEKARRVPGALNPTPRLWGVVEGPDGPVTVVAWNGRRDPALPALEALSPPSTGRAVVGSGIAAAQIGDRLSLAGHTTITVTVAGAFPPETGLATYRLVWLSPTDARRLMGLRPGQATDLAVFLHHPEEAFAIRADLAAAFPWPVDIVDRRSQQIRRDKGVLQQGSLGAAASLPALLAFALLVAATLTGVRSRRPHWGLLKALGWTSADIVRLQILQALVVAVPSVVGGVATAMVVVLIPSVAGVAAVWVTQSPPLPGLVLHPAGAALAVIETVLMVSLPYLITVLLGALRSAAGAPWDMLQNDGWGVQ